MPRPYPDQCPACTATVTTWVWVADLVAAPEWVVRGVPGAIVPLVPDPAGYGSLQLGPCGHVLRWSTGG